MICLLALFARRPDAVERPVKIETSMFWRTFALSTFAHFGDAGTNQLDFAASANGASCGLFGVWIVASDVVFGITLPAVAIVAHRGRVRERLDPVDRQRLVPARDRDDEVGAAEERRHVLARRVARHRVGADLVRERRVAEPSGRARSPTPSRCR